MPTVTCPSTARTPPTSRMIALLDAASSGATVAKTAVGTPTRCSDSSNAARWPDQRRKYSFSAAVAFIVSINRSPSNETAKNFARSICTLATPLSRSRVTTRSAAMFSSATATPRAASSAS